MASHMATDQSCLTSLTHSVEQWKRVLEEKASSAAELCHALDELRKYGALPTQVLQESKIGVAVNHLGKDVGMNGEVRKAAKALLADWKEMHRKRTRDPLPAETAPKCAKKVPETPEAVNQNLASAPKSRQRQKVLQMLEAALTGDEKNPASTALAVTIEEELHAQLEGSDKAYINQSRAIVFNLKDPVVWTVFCLVSQILNEGTRRLQSRPVVEGVVGVRRSCSGCIILNGSN